jgi:hypothetical protein
MEKVNKVVEKDPLKLKHVENSYVTPKVMYIILAASALCFILSIVFFLLNTVFSSKTTISDQNLIEDIQVDIKIMPS